VTAAPRVVEPSQPVFGPQVRSENDSVGVAADIIIGNIITDSAKIVLIYYPSVEILLVLMCAE
jgi:hypothetical protein